MKNVFGAQLLELYPVFGFWAKIILQKNWNKFKIILNILVILNKSLKTCRYSYVKF